MIQYKLYQLKLSITQIAVPADTFKFRQAFFFLLEGQEVANEKEN